MIRPKSMFKILIPVPSLSVFYTDNTKRTELDELKRMGVALRVVDLRVLLVQV